MMSEMDVLAVLNTLMAACRDDAKSHNLLASLLDNPLDRTLFQHEARRRGHFVDALGAVVCDRGGEPGLATLMEMLMRRWRVRSIARGTIGDVVEQCTRGGLATERVYEAALRRDLPERIRTLVMAQYVEIRETAGVLRRMRPGDTAP